MNRQGNKKSSTVPIARSINRAVLGNKFLVFLGIDLAVCLTVAALFLLHCTGWPHPVSRVTGLSLSGGSLRALAMQVSFASGKTVSYSFWEWFGPFAPAFAVGAGCELLDLFFSLFHTHRYRRRLRPLEDMARRAEALSAIPLDSTKFENLEAALRSAEPDGSGVHVDGGDADLARIETAINDLLKRTNESYQQQIRFVSDASHELRTPIAVIQGYADLLARWGKEDPQVLQEGISSIQSESEHMKELVEQLLFLARGDSGRNALHKERVDLNEIVKEVWEESCMIDADHVYELSERPGSFVFADAAMLKQSVRIFVQNAAKYSPAKNTIGLGVTLEGGRPAYVVRDEGEGMRESDLVHIFERFYRSDKARSSSTGGTGLGLSIAKWIIDAHDGEISVVSREDFGSRFTVSFPPADPLR